MTYFVTRGPVGESGFMNQIIKDCEARSIQPSERLLCDAGFWLGSPSFMSVGDTLSLSYGASKWVFL